jgi:nitroreductase
MSEPTVAPTSSLADAIHRRRAVRAYAATPIDEATLRALLEDAVHAPSAMNAQPWAFAVVQDRSTLRRWSDRAKAMLLAASGGDPKTSRYAVMLGSTDFNIFYDAGTLVVIGVDHVGPYTDADCWLAAANLMLSARARGLGTCPIGFAAGVLNSPDVKRELGFASEGRAVAPIIVGVPSADPPVVARNAPRITTWMRAGT